MRVFFFYLTLKRLGLHIVIIEKSELDLFELEAKRVLYQSYLTPSGTEYNQTNA